MIPVKVYLAVNKDLALLFDGLLPLVPRVGEEAKFPYKKTQIVARVVKVSHNFETKDVDLLVEILEDAPVMNAGSYVAAQFN